MRYSDNDKKRALEIFHGIETLFPDAKSELVNWNTPFQFLVCVILSAQTTDKQVNKLTKKLFEMFPSPKAFAHADLSDIEDLVKGVNYYKTKAKNIQKASSMVLSEFNGEVPTTIADLVKLPGVGYKTANVYLNEMFQANQGIAVDTHVARVAQRFGWTEHTDPNKIAKDLEALFPRELWFRVNTVLVLFGRYICTARNPKCDECPVREFCSVCRDTT